MELAWAAGLFDGEGTICTTKGNSPNRLRIYMAVAMADEEVVNRFFSALGIGKVEALGARTPKHKSIWRWRVWTRDTVRDSFLLLEPYLSAPKRAQGFHALGVFDDHRFSRIDTGGAA
jgi:hypothetical protein